MIERKGAEYMEKLAVQASKDVASGQLPSPGGYTGRAYVRQPDGTFAPEDGTKCQRQEPPDRRVRW